ncbi:hypothetical protein [Thalassobius sp. I31.1]|uniref:hypothetical protein n=1 Tax=Thalassobius sp. I31.1 TaxID=2109912 RepID=UPI0018E58FCF|nr:hypothetical protein [Thalassobius sp. I31.1]
MFYRISRAGFGTALFSRVKSKLSFFELDNILFPHAAMIAGGIAGSLIAFSTAANAQITMPVGSGSNGVFAGELIVNGTDIGDWTFTTQTANEASPTVQVPGGGFAV